MNYCEVIPNTFGEKGLIFNVGFISPRNILEDIL